MVIPVLVPVAKTKPLDPGKTPSVGYRGLAVVKEQLFLVKHDVMTLRKVGHATAHNNWSYVRNMRYLIEIPNNNPSVSARR